MRPLSIALVHHPVLDAHGTTVTSAITNLDFHDLARSARTYGCRHYFLTHPIAAQRELMAKIREHWIHGSSGRRIPDRKEALELVRIVPTVADVLTELGGRENVELWATAARSLTAQPLAYRAARQELEGSGKHVLLLFGTSWGLAPELVDSCDRILEPLRGAPGAEYNHLSVRSACAIILDRLRG